MKKIATLNAYIGFAKDFSSQIFFLFVILFSINTYAQGPGCPNVDAGIDIELDCDDPCTDLTATYLQTGETTSYEVSAITYDPPFPTTGGTPVSVNTDDVWSNAIQLPFDFCFYGQTYSEMLIGSNTVITFDLQNNEPGGFCQWAFSESIPNSNLFSTTIFGPYMDVDPSVSGSGQINWAVFGEAPCRTMVVNFPDIPYFSCTDISMTTQIVIYETTNVVEVYLEGRSDQCSDWNSGNAVLGMQNQGGTEGITAPDRNTGNWEATNEAWRFTPNGASNIDFVWLNEAGEVIGTEPTINVCPTESSTTYTAQAIYTNCNGDVITETDDVTITMVDGFTVDLGGDQVLCDANNHTITAEIIGEDATDATFLWSTGETSQTITVTESGTYTVEVTINGCLQSASVSVILESTPEIILADDFKICLGENVQLTATTPEDGITYQWIFNGNEVGNSNTLTIDNITENEIGTYEVIISKGVCEWTDEVDISTYEIGNCIITQGLSPGGTPGFNDRLDLEFLNDRTGISKLQIFNRYGTLVYERNNYINEWVGQDNNDNELPTGTYYYVIDLLGEDDVYGTQPVGWIYLNRDAN